MHAFLQRLSELAQIFFLFLTLVQRQRAVGVFWDAADEVEGVAVPVVELVAALMDFLLPALGADSLPALRKLAAPGEVWNRQGNFLEFGASLRVDKSSRGKSDTRSIRVPAPNIFYP